ncbi:hypothetical protein JTB14_036797 [Gonioctena quinquepunctata]|nr:hypothetical protein JTB14_036797 [Gonioctena quinquepunctata]
MWRLAVLLGVDWLWTLVAAELELTLCSRLIYCSIYSTGYALFEELQKRTQHPSETIGVYLAVISSHFSRLGCPTSEEVKLSIVMKNLHPFYQDRLRDPLPTSLAELRVLCRRMESRRDIINGYVEPPSRRANVMEKDLAYVDVAEEISALEVATSQVPAVDQTKQTVCFRLLWVQEGGVHFKELSQLRGVGKRQAAALRGRVKGAGKSSSTTMFQPVLDFILDNAENDERPYLEVGILGRSILGLLDSGVLATILGIRGWKMAKDFVELDISQKISCTVANGKVCQSMGECEVPVSLRGRVKLIRD